MASEIKQYTNDTLRSRPAEIRRYEEEIRGTHRGHEEGEPTGTRAGPLRDQVLFMKHNLRPGDRRAER